MPVVNGVSSAVFNDCTCAVILIRAVRTLLTHTCSMYVNCTLYVLLVFSAAMGGRRWVRLSNHSMKW